MNEISVDTVVKNDLLEDHSKYWFLTPEEAGTFAKDMFVFKTKGAKNNV